MSTLSYISISTAGEEGKEPTFIYVSASFAEVIGHKDKEVANEKTTLVFPYKSTWYSSLRCLTDLQAFGAILYNNIVTQYGDILLQSVLFCCEDIHICINRKLAQEDFVEGILLESTCMAETVICVDHDDIYIRTHEGVLKVKGEVYPIIAASIPPYPKNQPRVGFILNHFSDLCTISYCIGNSEKTLGICKKNLLETSFYNYVDSCERDLVEEEIRNIKIGKFRSLVSQIEFTFLSPKGNLDINAGICYSSDGIVVMLMLLDPSEFFLDKGL